MYVKVYSDLFSSLFNKEPVLLFIYCQLFFRKRLGNFVKIFLIILLEFGPENFGKYFVDLNKMTKLNHTIGFINNEILKILKVENFIFEKLVNSAWGPYDYMRFALTDDSELFLLWHSTNDGYDRNVELDVLKYLGNILLNLLCKLSCWGNYQAK